MKPKCEKCDRELTDRDMSKSSRDYLCPDCDAGGLPKKLDEQIKDGKHNKGR
jgi:uncharacterized protein YlaI